MNIVITGGAGFLGSHLCEKLLSQKHKVICVDNFITGSMENIRAFLKDKNFKLKMHDISNHITIENKVDYVLHFASPASPSDYLDFPIQTLKVGSLGTHNALGLAKEKKAKFLLASTSEVYGDPLVHPQKEGYWGNVNPIGPRGVYDEAKRFAESITLAYHRVHKIDTKIVRIFNTFGPGMRKNDGRAIPNFIYQAVHNKPITIYGTGKQTRSFCYIDDLINGILKLMKSKLNVPVNIGNPKEMTLLELVKDIIKITGSKSKIVFKNLPIDDPKKRRPDISRAKKCLGWEPKYSVHQGLLKTVEWFK
ncbi:MAG: UDP-glucuronic acid decarboxylase family protein [Candidatus Omnitrophota bacterium]